jgi:Tfp pilus assembly protein PilF
MGLIRYHSIEEIKETLKNAKSRRRGCTLLIGAGCSAEAGIPTAAGFVDIIKDQYPLSYQRASEKTYPKCMAELLLAERRDLTAKYVDQAKLNWAHLCIALLMQAGYVDRVLTTNFDLLVTRACAMLGVFPAIYDFATSQLLKKADVPDQAVFYLHGQRTGFVLMNTDEDMKRHSLLLGPVFEDAGSGRVWVVVGYSGESDPVFNHLANVQKFDNGLFWVGYRDQEPAAHVRDQLLTQEKDAFFTKGVDADSFFVGLTRALDIFPPNLVKRPFTYLKETLNYITSFVDPSQTFEGENDVMRTTRELILMAIARFEDEKSELVMILSARYLLMKGHYEQVLVFRADFDKAPSAELGDVLSMAYVLQGNRLLDLAKATSSRAADGIFDEAKEMYRTALEIQPDRHEALHNWGNLLLDMAKRAKTREDSAKLFVAAEEKYNAALAIKPGIPEILLNWGNLLLDRAKIRVGKESHQLFESAEEKYREALVIKPDMPDAFYQWGNVLLDRAKTMTDTEESDPLFEAAAEKYSAALDIKPDMYEALNNWGNLLLDQAKTKKGAAADKLFEDAAKKYQSALTIKPDLYEAMNNWGNLLLDHAKTKKGAAAGKLFEEAAKKYQSALTIKPDMCDALNNWGNLLLDQAKTKKGHSADNLLAQAEKKYESAIAIHPDAEDVLRNWGTLLQYWGSIKTGEEATQLFAKAKEKFKGAGM